MDKKQIIEEYARLQDLEYPKPPRDVGGMLKATLKKTDNEVLTIIKDGVLISVVAIIKVSRNVFVIHGIITKKEYRNNGFGKQLMKRVHKKFKGVFIVNTITARKFYKKLGYVYVGSNTLIFINNAEIGTRDYWLK